MTAAWREPLARALHRNRALIYSRYLQLATVRSDGTPANRTVVFRGFRPETNDLQMISDQRSEKVEQLRRNSVAEACWYFPKTREQFRLRGSLQVVTALAEEQALKQARQDLWRSLSTSAQQQFTWPPPGHPREAEAYAVWTQPAPLHPPACFCLLLLTVELVDHLQLRGEPQQRRLYQHITTGWSQVEINP
jgi:PPOX class probable FMN-dependent enzyme